MAVLIVRAPMFSSAGDETAFFGWLRRIRAVSNASARGRDLHVTLRDGKISSDEIHELRALFHRWGLDTSELESLRG